MKKTRSDRIRIPESAVKELEIVENTDWGEGIALSQIIDWINQIVTMYRPDTIDSRSSQNFTPRSFRHYQTLGCIDSPTRVGKSARYGFRHYLQGLLVRKLLWERVPSEQIVLALKGRTNDDYKQLLFQGMEIVAREGEVFEHTHFVGKTETWTRSVVAPGVELHVREDAFPRDHGAMEQILSSVERTWRTRMKELKMGKPGKPPSSPEG